MATIIGLCLAGAGLVGILLILLMPSKNEVPTMEYEAKHCKIIWGFWYTGAKHYKFIKKGCNIKRMLLMKPNSKAFNENVKASGAHKEIVEQEIKSVTDKAIKSGVMVRWYSNFQDVSITLCDEINGDEPLSNKAYCVVQILEQKAPSDNRPQYCRKKKNDEAYYMSQFNKFKEFWDSIGLSYEPKPEEYESGGS